MTGSYLADSWDELAPIIFEAAASGFQIVEDYGLGLILTEVHALNNLQSDTLNAQGHGASHTTSFMDQACLELQC